MSRQGKTGSAVVEGDRDRDMVIFHEQVQQTHKDSRLSGRGILKKSTVDTLMRQITP